LEVTGRVDVSSADRHAQRVKGYILAIHDRPKMTAAPRHSITATNSAITRQQYAYSDPLVDKWVIQINHYDLSLPTKNKK
jgi:hypothetical protein